MPAVAIDVSDFRAVAKALKKAQPELYRGVGEALDRAGTLVAAEAEQIAAEHSESIPPTIRVQRRLLNVTVWAGGEGYPIAGLYEYGNKGGSSSAANNARGQFRHPVFGKDIWVNQTRYPYLWPAGQRKLPEVDAMVGAVLDIVTQIIVLSN